MNALDDNVQAMHARALGHLTSEELQSLSALPVKARTSGAPPGEDDA